jgi:signal transduction histidine kinase
MGMFSRFRRAGSGEPSGSTSLPSEVLGRVSHELRTPLNAIIGFAQLLEADPLSDAQRECLEQIMAGAQHMLAVAGQLLESASARVATLETLELGALVADAVALCRPLAAAQALQLRSAPLLEERWATGNPSAVTQVLLNLLSNAIKYNRPGGSISIDVLADGDFTRVDVSDTGIGIHRDRIGRLFQPFERLDAPARGIEGTGLGLALSRTIAEGMGGTIEARSEPQRGSTFSVRLRSAPPPSATAPVAECRPARSRHRIAAAY